MAGRKGGRIWMVRRGEVGSGREGTEVESGGRERGRGGR